MSPNDENIARKPPIRMTDADYDRIAEMALGIEKTAPALSKLLLDEMDRATILPAGALPADVVALGSEVEFLDEMAGTRRTVRLVLPRSADVEADRISILTPIGAGLIGLAVGSEIGWPYPDGRPRVLKILAVRQDESSEPVDGSDTP
jgi:regulator of nucleoside diphosphate kinase